MSRDVSPPLPMRWPYLTLECPNVRKGWVVVSASKLLTAGGVVTCAVEPNLGQTDSKWATRKGKGGPAGLSDECDWSYGRNGGPLDRMVRGGMSGGTTALKTDTLLRNGRHDTTVFFDQHLGEFLIQTKRLMRHIENIFL